MENCEWKISENLANSLAALETSTIGFLNYDYILG